MGVKMRTAVQSYTEELLKKEMAITRGSASSSGHRNSLHICLQLRFSKNSVQVCNKPDNGYNL